MYTSELIVTPVVSGKSQVTLYEISRLMQENQTDCIILVKQHPETQKHYPIGLVTEQDLVLLLLEYDGNTAIETLPACSRNPLIIINVNDSISQAAFLMHKFAVHHLPVTYDDGSLAGLLNLDALLVYLSTSFQPNIAPRPADRTADRHLQLIRSQS